MKHFKNVHLVLEETEGYNKGDGLQVTLDTSYDKEEIDYDIGIDAVSEGGYSGIYYEISLKDLFYKIKNIIPYEWIADIKEDKRNEK